MALLYCVFVVSCIWFQVHKLVLSPFPGITQQTEGDLLGINGRRDAGEYETVFFSLSQVWGCIFWLRALLMKEADKLACLVLFLLFQFHSTVRAHFERGDKVRRPIRIF